MKRTRTKRILALVLVLALAFTSFAMLASASEADIEERDAYSCPVCGTVLRHYTDEEVIWSVMTACMISTEMHAHKVKDIYNVDECPSCDYVNRTYSHQVFECTANF